MQLGVISKTLVQNMTWAQSVGTAVATTGKRLRVLASTALYGPRNVVYEDGTVTATIETEGTYGLDVFSGIYSKQAGWIGSVVATSHPNMTRWPRGGSICLLAVLNSGHSGIAETICTTTFGVELTPAIPLSRRFETQNNTVFVYIAFGVTDLKARQDPLIPVRFVLAKIAVLSNSVPLLEVRSSWTFQPGPIWRLPSQIVYLEDSWPEGPFVDMLVESISGVGIIRFDTRALPDAPWNTMPFEVFKDECSLTNPGCDCDLYYFGNGVQLAC